MAEIPFAALPSGGGVKCGVFTGDGTVGRKISLGVTPAWVAVWNESGLQGFFDYGNAASAGGFAIRGYPCYLPGKTTTSVEIADGGFVVNSCSNGWCNGINHSYYYLYGI